MANTVNDVMDVIASPDYGIKNIAGTNQEILAILQGTHNSPNNIHAIANEIKFLLQELITVSTKNKPVEVGGNFSKVNHKNIQNILDETKGIRKAIDNLAKNLTKQGWGTPAIAKLSDKASEKIAEAMTKNIEKQNKGGAISALVDAFSKLKNISIKDIFIGNLKIKKITKMFKNAKKELKINEKHLNSIIKLINASPEIVNALAKIGKKINRIIKNKTIKKLNDILVGKSSILSIAQSLQKNEKVFNKAGKISKSLKDLASLLNKAMKELFFASLWAKVAGNGVQSVEKVLDKLIPLSKKLSKNEKNFNKADKASKKIKELASLLNKAMTELFFASLWAKVANNGVQSIEKVLDKLIPLTTKLSKNEKNIKQGAKAAKNLTPLAGNLLITSILLTITAVVGLPAILGAMTLGVIVDALMPVATKLSKNEKNIKQGAKTAKNLTPLVGNLLLTSILLSITAVVVLPAILGAMTLGVIIDTLMPVATKLSKNEKNIKQGAKAAKKLIPLVGNLLLTSILLTITAVVGIPAILGALALGVIINTLMPVAKNLSKNNKHIRKAIISSIGIAAFTGIMTVTTLMLTLVAKNGVLALLGSLVLLGVTTLNIITFKMLSKAQRHIIKGAIIMGIMSLALLIYGIALNKITSATKGVTFKQVAIIATTTVLLGLAVAALGIPAVFPFVALGSIAMLLMGVSLIPFGIALKKISESTKDLKMKHILLVAGSMVTLAAGISAMAVFLVPVILGSITLRLMMPPLLKFVKSLDMLSKMKTIPTKQLNQSLNSMKFVGDFFKNNGISLKAIWNAKKYQWVLNPFYSAVNKLGKLKEISVIPMNIVNSALNAISAISNFYQGQDLGFFGGISARVSANMITGIVNSFGKAVKSFKYLKELKNVPANAINSIINSISSIVLYYKNVKFGYNTEEKSSITEYVVGKFTTLAMNIQEKLNNIKSVNYDAIKSIIFSCRLIIDYYNTYTKILLSQKKILNMNGTIKLFTSSAKNLKSIEFDKTKDDSIKNVVESMGKIMRFLKYETLNPFQRIQARKNISMLNTVTSVVSKLSNINTSNMLSIGDALSNTLSGIKTVDMGQVIAVTNMFNAFGKISKSENVINKFTESVKEFTKTCKDLMDAMSNNTDAINNMDAYGSKKSNSIFENIKEKASSFIGGDSNDNNTYIQTNSVRIANVDELAKNIADKINGALSVDVADTQIQLLINGTGGNEWTITKY